jgi:hypothetical protein
MTSGDRQAWSPADDERLRKLALSGVSLTEIAAQMARAKSSVRTRSRAEGEGEMTMRILLVLAVIGFSATAFAQNAPPKVGRPLAQIKPKEPIGCKLVGTVKGTKLWAGDCVASELRGSRDGYAIVA